jgi:signal transduction histidine kinase
LSAGRVHGQVLAVVAEATRALGFEPDVTLVGDDERTVPTDVAEHLLVVVREALTNVARHAAATEAAVEVEMNDTIAVTVTDDGVGVGAHPRSGGYGLQNMRDRASAVGGHLDVGARPEGGTVVRWWVRR